MFCKRLQATMTVSTCQKRQKKALTSGALKFFEFRCNPGASAIPAFLIEFLDPRKK